MEMWNKVCLRVLGLYMVSGTISCSLDDSVQTKYFCTRLVVSTLWSPEGFMVLVLKGSFFTTIKTLKKQKKSTGCSPATCCRFLLLEDLKIHRIPEEYSIFFYTKKVCDAGSIYTDGIHAGQKEEIFLPLKCSGGE